MKALWRWLNAKEWRIVTAVVLGFVTVCGIIVYLAVRDVRRQCREKGTHTVCTREVLGMTKIGDTYVAHNICVEYAEEPCE